MRNKFTTVVLIISIFSNIALLYLYNQKKVEAEHRLNNLYFSFESGIATYYAHLTNAKEGRGNEHLL